MAIIFSKLVVIRIDEKATGASARAIRKQSELAMGFPGHRHRHRQNRNHHHHRNRHDNHDSSPTTRQ